MWYIYKPISPCNLIKHSLFFSFLYFVIYISLLYKLVDPSSTLVIPSRMMTSSVNMNIIIISGLPDDLVESGGRYVTEIGGDTDRAANWVRPVDRYGACLGAAPVCNQ